jgi:hypothetical protein
MAAGFSGADCFEVVRSNLSYAACRFLTSTATVAGPGSIVMLEMLRP